MKANDVIITYYLFQCVFLPLLSNEYMITRSTQISTVDIDWNQIMFWSNIIIDVINCPQTGLQLRGYLQ